MDTDYTPLVAHDPPCPNLCCSGIWRTEYLPNLDSDLSNDLHPLFADGWFSLGPSIHLSKLLVARRFASRLLTTASLLPFWYVMFFTNTYTLEGKTSNGALQHVFQEPPHAITPEQAEETKAVLEFLATCDTFYIHFHAACARGAHCVSDWKSKAPPPLKCHSSRIEIGEELMKTFLEAQTLDAASHAWAPFDFGVTLVHEISHAALAAVRKPDPHNVYYFGDSSVAEKGFELESRVFGGFSGRHLISSKNSYPLYVTNGEPSQLLAAIVLTDWPDASVADRYKKRGYLIGDRGSPLAATLEWQIPFRVSLEILTDRYWDQEAATRGVKALHLPKMKGFMVIPVPNPNVDVSRGRILTTETIERFPDAVVPDGYAMMPSGLVVRLPPPAPTDVGFESWSVGDTKMTDV